MIEVHHLNNSRSQRVLWMLEELGTPYTIVHYQRDAKTRLAPPELKAVHPLGKSPVIRDGEQTIAESAVILEHLVERYGNGKFVLEKNTKAFDNYRYWMHYAEASLMTPLLIKLYVSRLGDAAQSINQRMDDTVQIHLAFIEQELGAKTFLTGDELTAADIQLSFPVELIATQGKLDDQYPKVRSWLRRLHERPAYKRALAKGGPYAYAQD